MIIGIIYGVLFVAFIIGVIYFGIQRAKDKKKETFEKRDN